MTLAKWLTLIGGILATAGVLAAFMSSRYHDKVMGNARLGVAVLAPEKDSPEMREKENKLWWADFSFKLALWAAGIGGVLQTIGGILPDGKETG